MNDMLKISDIMTTNLVTFNLDTPVYDIVKSMADKKISSIIIVENNKPMGIITERDILKASLSPEENLKKLASELMSSPVLSMKKNVDYRDAYMQMTEHKIRHLVVVEETGELLGMLSESDFLSHLNPEQLLAIKEVSKVMTAKVLTCTPSDSVYSVLAQMAEFRVGGIVVQENDEAVGVVSERDALKLIHKSSIELQEPIRAYMSSPVITIHKEQTVLNAQSMMENFSIRRIVVLDDDEKIAGIITRHDLIKSIPDYYVEILREMMDRQRKLVSQTKIKLDEETIFHNAMKSLPHNLVFMTNKDESIQFVNAKESQICNVPSIKIGSQLESLEGILFELIKESKWKEFVKQGKTLHKIVKVANKYADFCYFNTSISAILNTENEFEGYMYIARDISEQQTLEQELKRLNDKLQEAYTVAKIGNFELDAKTLDAFWSNEIYDIFGMEKDSMGGPNVLKTLVKPEVFPVIKDSLISALETGSSHELVYEVFPKNGSESSWVECRARRELDEEGNPKSLIGTVQDVTHRVQAEKRIEHLNSLLKAIRNINQLIVKEKDTNILMQAICEEITVVEHFFAVWVLLDGKERKLYSSGFEGEGLAKLEQNVSAGILPSCCSIEDKLQTFKEPKVTCMSCFLSESYQNSDAIVVPLEHEGNFYGHICFSIGNDLIKDEEEKALLQEIADDIGFSIYTTKERELNEKEQKRYKSLIEDSHDGIYMHTLGGVVIDANPMLAKIQGCSRSELIGMNVKEFYQEQDYERARSHFRTIKEKGTIHFEMELKKINGTLFHTEVVASLVEFDGEMVIQGSLRDITKRIEAEKKAHENEKIMMLALETAGHGVWDWNVPADTIYYSPQWKSMLGYRADEIKNHISSFYALLHPDDIVETTLKLEEFFKDRTTKYSLTFRLRAKDGTYRWILSTGAMLSFDKDGEPLRFIGTHTDITEQKLLEEEVKKSAETLYKLTENIPGAIYQYKLCPDGSSSFPYVSQGIENIYEVSAQDVRYDATSVFNRIHKDDLDRVVESIENSAKILQEWNLEYRVNLPQKGLCWLHGRSKPEKLEDGSIVWHGIINDITEKKKLENELHLFKRSVESSNEGISITEAGDDEPIIYVNPAFERLTGYSLEETLGKNLRLLNELNREQPELELLNNAIKKQESIGVELKNYRKDGSEFISKLTVDPILDENKKVTHFVGIQKDITKEHKVLNQLILQSESLEKSHAGISMVDVNKQFVYANASYINMWGYHNEAEILGTSPTLST
ncbi:MAG: diguanylate cyclase/phosphodiesterase (GGDEF & EAL domains) with PAS/PAC sensor(s) [uncultured Sulfurovum sp.]|uniref:histidine kinase n=1 Tax=uncultured Sulfurovum sp. TaxID=269237 RepID=A0A6S6TQ59_9BACT|nr:MAG: diguanylate cyclase/phosphodiesterase (GGDEF & EAL domains) with PAS/PAC sensor(s) [uncultured Sulfurovum sp.]